MFIVRFDLDRFLRKTRRYKYAQNTKTILHLICIFFSYIHENINFSVINKTQLQIVTAKSNKQ